MCHPNLSGLNGTHLLYQSHGHWKVSRPDVKRWNPKQETTAAKLTLKTRYMLDDLCWCVSFFFNVKKSRWSCFGQIFLKGEWGELPYSIEPPTLTPVPGFRGRASRPGGSIPWTWMDSKRYPARQKLKWKRCHNFFFPSVLHIQYDLLPVWEHNAGLERKIP